VVGVVDRVLDQMSHEVTVEAAKDLGGLAACSHEPRHPELREVLGDAGRRPSDRLGEFVHGQLAVEERPGQPDPGRVGEHPEDLDSQIDLFGGWLVLHVSAHLRVDADGCDTPSRDISETCGDQCEADAEEAATAIIAAQESRTPDTR
jgi:hypothetical protein